MLWPVQRRWALTMLTCVSWDSALRVWRVRRDVAEARGKPLDTSDRLFGASTEADLRNVWARSRSATIRRFRLEGLVSEEP